MRVLVVDPQRTERETTLRLISSETHDVRQASDAGSALTLMEGTEFDVVLVESTMTGVTGNELIKRIRARESCTHVYVIASAARPVPGDLKAAFQAGADDFIRKPMSRDELLARVDGPARIRRWAARILTTGVSEEFSHRSGISSISAWTSVDSSVCSEISDMLGFQLSPVAAQDALDGAVTVATLPLSLASEHAEVCLAVGVDGISSTALAEAMFGTPTVETAAIKDMMREIANVAAGAFKRVAAAEGRTFTTGLPSEVTPEHFRKPNAIARRQWVGACEKSPIRLQFEIELRVSEVKRVRVSGLREGMVVAADLRTANGALLIRSGTRLTESALAGMRGALGEQGMVEVVEPD